MANTLEVLPGEGKIKTVYKKLMRHCCGNCGQPAHYKHTFLLPNARNNPDSNAYGLDDCSWSADEVQFSCTDLKCQQKMKQLKGYYWCSTFSATARFSHMFLYWETIKEE